MPRPLRSDVSGTIYLALKRGNARNDIFFKQADDEAFERVIAEGLQKYPVDLICYQWIKNHWHMVLSPRADKAMSYVSVSGLGDDDSYAACCKFLKIASKST